MRRSWVFLLSMGCYASHGSREDGLPDGGADARARVGEPDATVDVAAPDDREGPCPECPDDADGCRVVPSVPVDLQLPATACPGDVLTVTLAHEVEGCGCSRDYVMSWTQVEWTVEIVAEVRYCPHRCYDHLDCRDSFTTRGHLIVRTPGRYEVRAASLRREVHVSPCG